MPQIVAFFQRLLNRRNNSTTINTISPNNNIILLSPFYNYNLQLLCKTGIKLIKNEKHQKQKLLMFF